MTVTLPGAGDLRETVSFARQAAAASDGYGNTVAGLWSPLSTAKARVEPVKGGEAVLASRLTGTALWYVTVRSESFTRTITTDDRITLPGSVTGNIRWVANLDLRARYLTLLVETGVAV